VKLQKNKQPLQRPLSDEFAFEQSLLSKITYNDAILADFPASLERCTTVTEENKNEKRVVQLRFQNIEAIKKLVLKS
jgi:hypothetical protein